MLRRTDTGHNMSKEMSDEHKECCDGHEAEHNMSKRCQMNTKDVATDMRQDTTCRKRCQTNTKDVAMDRHRTQHVERDVRRTQKMLR